MKRKIITVIFVLVLVIAGGLLIYLNRGFFGGIQIKTVFTYDTEHSFIGSGNELVAVSNDGIIAMDDRGVKKWNAVCQMSSPHALSKGDYTLLFDKGGYDVRIFKKDTKSADITTNQPVLNAKINKNGYCTVVSYEIGYKSKIEVYDKKGALVYTWKLGEGYAIDADLSPDGKTLSAIILYTDGGALESCVAIADINREIEVAQHRKKDSLLFYISYQSDGDFVVVGETETLGYTAGGKEKWRVGYGDKALQHFEVPYSSNIVLVYAGGRNNSIIEMYDAHGAKCGEYITESEVGALDSNGKTIAAALNREVVLLSEKGKEKTRFATGKDISDVVLLSEKKTAVISANSVEIAR